MNGDIGDFEPTIINAEPVRDHLIADLTRAVNGLRRDVKMRPLIAGLVAVIVLLLMGILFLLYYTFVTAPNIHSLEQRVSVLESHLSAKVTTTTTTTQVSSATVPTIRGTPTTANGAKSQPTQSPVSPSTTTTSTTTPPNSTTTTTAPTTTTTRPCLVPNLCIKGVTQ